jgi:hypothetical protein
MVGSIPSATQPSRNMFVHSKVRDHWQEYFTFREGGDGWIGTVCNLASWKHVCSLKGKRSWPRVPYLS